MTTATTTTKTLPQLATAVMRRLGMIDPNKEPTASEQAIIIDHYYNKLEELRPEDLIYWPEDAIPRAAFEAMVRIVAHQFSTTLGQDIPTEQMENGDVVAIGTAGMRMLRRHMARSASGLPIRANYF